MKIIPHQAPAATPRRGERGVALVITLILLSVTLVMAIAFLALSNREREATATANDAAQARLAAQSALASAQAQIVANIYANKSAAYNYGLLVSTNFINADGFDQTIAGFDPRNVSYNYFNGQPLTTAHLIENLENLQFLPRAPVFIATNALGNTDFRFYLDLNRNGRYDTNGWVTNQIYSGGTLMGDGTTNLQVGDPEWVGQLQRPDQPHSSGNQFVSRYAFIAVPVGNALDVNYLHNQAMSDLNSTLNIAQDNFYRDQGIGSWELNLAGFLVDLNTNIWDPVLLSSPAANNYYEYQQPAGANYGIAFNDAFTLYTNRLAGSYANLTAANNYFTNAAFGVNPDVYFQNGIDLYDDNFTLRNTSAPWLGADNPNRFFSSVDDFFNPAAIGANFSTRLLGAGFGTVAGTGPDTYDRYTFYRLLAQLGTDSSADNGKLNLNFMNVNTANGTVVPGMETNTIRWPDGLTFFTNAVDHMLRTYTTNWFQRNPSNYLASYFGVITNFTSADGFGLTNFPYFGITNQIPGFGIANIPVYLNGRFIYSPAINRVLQLAANIYDASTNADWPNPAFFPSVFRPLLYKTNYTLNGFQNNYIYISGFEQVTSLPAVPTVQMMPTNIETLAALPVGSGTLSLTNYNVYGVPWILGAKKYMPGFSQLSLLNDVQVTRKLQFTRSDLTAAATITTNQCYVISISNYINAVYWNSYQSNYPGGTLTLFAQDTPNMTLFTDTATYGGVSVPTWWTITTNVWHGSGWNTNTLAISRNAPIASSFVPLSFGYGFIPPQSFWPSTEQFFLGTNVFDTGPIKPLPSLQLVTTNWFFGYIVDQGAGNRIVDYVQLLGPYDSTNISSALADAYPAPDGTTPPDKFVWATNSLPLGGFEGIFQQWGISMGSVPVGDSIWATVPGLLPNSTQMEIFANFFNGSVNNSLLAIQAPFSPTRTLYCPYLYQVNDPLVHYLPSDLGGLPGSSAQWYKQIYVNGLWTHDDMQPAAVPQVVLTALPGRYQPWGKNKQMAALGGVNTNAFDSAIKDPLVWGSDYWNFPESLYPTVGWLGQVHRGTPWQSVYLKSSDVLGETYNAITGGATNYQNNGLNTWMAWGGDTDPFDAANEAPVQDRLLFDIFTTQPNDNASHGKLSVNQPHIAAWSALFSGMGAKQNNTFPQSLLFPTPTTKVPTENVVMSPAGLAGQSSQLWYVYTNITSYRSNGFVHVGDVLAVPALTEQSPFLMTTGLLSGTYPQSKYGISDELYEQIPMQAMGLLRASDAPRYVIYGYGQALRPAPNSFYPTANGNLVTNYQIMAETGIRAVVQVHPQITATPTGYVTNFTTVLESYNQLPPQ